VRVWDERFKAHVGGGGRQGSWWLVIGIGRIFMLAILGVIFALAFAFPSLFVAGRM
jgi:hypothetical protein